MGTVVITVGAGVGWTIRIIQKYKNVSKYIEKIMGVLLIIMGIMLFIGTFAELKRFGILVDFGL